jgi:hypothetical protein
MKMISTSRQPSTFWWYTQMERVVCHGLLEFHALTRAIVKLQVAIIEGLSTRSKRRWFWGFREDESSYTKYDTNCHLLFGIMQRYIFLFYLSKNNYQKRLDWLFGDCRTLTSLLNSKTNIDNKKM